MYKDLLKYIDFLNSCGYNISISCFKKLFEPYTANLFPYGIHNHSVCQYLKTNPLTKGKCIENKKQFENKKITEPSYCCCFAGIEEFVYPVWFNGELILSVHVSGFRNNLKKSKLRAKCMAKLCGKDFLEHYNILNPTLPDQKKLLQFIKPIEYMAIALYKHCLDLSNQNKISLSKEIYLNATEFIHQNYMRNISCNEIAKYMNYSVSYLQYVFKKEGNTTINKTINNIRFKRSCFLLKSTRLSITEIAFLCGFCDSNYFSTTFKKRMKMSPKDYRTN